VLTQTERKQDLLQPHDKSRFEHLVLPHLDGAFNLACWLLRNRADGEDVVQEAMLRAYRFFDRFQGDDARAWLLQIVRNTCYSWLGKNRPFELTTEFDEELHQRPGPTPEAVAAQNHERYQLMQALESLPARSREIIVLRGLEGCSYKEIADIVGVPIGTVMSTLFRARERLQRSLRSYAAAKEA
jgi:RNA polymerase sigma factor (sigma-70 family)